VNSWVAHYVRHPGLAQWLRAWQWYTPAHLLLTLEWLFLLGSTLTNLVLTLPGRSLATASPGAGIPLWQVLTILTFGLMGLKRPKRHVGWKALYTLAEFGLVYVPIFLDPRLFHIFPPLHLIIVIRSCSMFGRFGQLMTTAVADALFCITLFSQPLNLLLPQGIKLDPILANIMLTARLNGMFAFILVSAFILILVNALLFMQRSRQELAQAHEQLRHYALRIEDQATLQERNRIAREMHDALGHTLTAQSLQLETVHCFWHSDSDRAFRALHEAKRLGAQALQDVRQTISTLRADPLQGLPLDEAIATLIHTFYQTTGILPQCTVRLTMLPPKNINLCVYRIVQEALTNSAKHSQATEIRIYLQSTAKQLNVLIQDNGVGFDPNQNQSGFGLQGMQERTLALDGLFSVVSQPGLGCKIMAQIPFAESAQPA
jgi:signal transduction histidine kinase